MVVLIQGDGKDFFSEINTFSDFLSVDWFYYGDCFSEMQAIVLPSKATKFYVMTTFAILSRPYLAASSRFHTSAFSECSEQNQLSERM